MPPKMRKLKVAEAAEILGVQPQKLRRMTEAGEVKSLRLANGYRVYDQREIARAAAARVEELKQLAQKRGTDEGIVWPNTNWQPTPDSNLLTGEQAAGKLGVSRETLRRWEQAGTIASVRVNRRKMFYPETVAILAKEMVS